MNFPAYPGTSLRVKGGAALEHSAVLLLLACAAVGMSGCSPAAPRDNASAKPLHVWCGSSMAAPVQELIGSFELQHGPVQLDLGGSETLWPRILAGAAADVFVCHDPFGDQVRAAGKVSRVVTVGELRPVVLVRPGNPQHLRRLEDLARENLKLGLGDPRYSTCGELFVQVLQQRGLSDAVMRNVTLQGRSHVEIANGLILGPLDAVVVWNFVACLYEGKVTLAPMSIDAPPVAVTVVGLSTSAHPTQRDAFLEWCARTEGRAVFTRHGYGPASPAGE